MKSLTTLRNPDNLKALIKFILFSGFGLFMFMFPMPGQESFATPISLITDLTDQYLQKTTPYLLLLIITIAVLGIFIAKLFRPTILTEKLWLKDLFFVDNWIMITKIIALIVTLCVMFDIGPEIIRSEDNGATMVGLAKTLIAIAITLSFILPFLTDCGIMEFVGVLLKPLIRPLFHVPGRASVDLIASWLASSNTAVLITANQYNSNYYTKREAATIMTNFSLVSIPFCLVVAQTLNLAHIFPLLYLTITGIGIFLAIIGVRLYPLKNIADTYCHGAGEKLNEEVPEDTKLFHWALSAAIDRAKNFRLSKAFCDGLKMTIGIVLDIIPIVVAWGTIGSLLVNCTPIFYWLSYPMGLYLQLFGVSEAFTIAPATLVGFIDMFIPALIMPSDLSEQGKFIVGVLSLVQIIYMTEVGSIIVKSNVGLGIKHLFIIFLQRTIIAIPIVVLISKLI